MTQETREEDRKKFVRLANKRVNNAMKYLRLIGNLSNTTNYNYQDDDVQKIFTTLENALEECKQRFDRKKKERENFNIEE